MTSITSLKFGLYSTALAALATATLVFPGHAEAQDDVTTWRVQSHWPSGSSTYQDSLEHLKEVIEERSEGRLRLDLHGAGSLFKASEIFNAVQRGVIEMGTILPGYAEDKMTLSVIASGLPFAFRNSWEAAYFHDNLGFEEMLREEAAQYGVYYASDRIYPVHLVTKQPIESIEDLEAMKIRSSGTMQTFLDDAGAAVSNIAGPELYPALDNGVVDGAHWGGVSGADTLNLFETAKYLVQPALTYSSTDAIIVNQQALDGLPDDLQTIVKQALKEQFSYRTNEYLFLEHAALQRVKEEQGVKENVLPDEVQAHLLEAARGIWEKGSDRSDEASEALEMLEEFLGELDYI